VGDIRFTETLTPTTFDFEIVRGEDRVDVRGDDGGDVRIQRGGRAMAVRITAASPEEVAAIRRMLTDSVAIAGLDRVAARAVSDGSRLAPLLQAATAFVSLLQGRGGPTLSLARSAVAPGGFLPTAQTRAGGPEECWDTYVRSVNRYVRELEGCIREAKERWWEVHRPYLCGTEYDLKVVLAGFWLIDCHGTGWP
jgi:hypothetical protein